MSSENLNQTSSSTNTKKMTFMSVYFLGINAVIGSGAFLLPQELYQDVGVLSILTIFCAALTVSIIALCYADLSSRFSGSGAAWLYSYNAFGKYTGYQIGLFSWFLGCLTLSAEVVGLFRTLKNIIPALNDPMLELVLPIALILILAFINFFGKGIVQLIDNVSSTFKILTILFFIVAGIFLVKKANFHPILPADINSKGGLTHQFGSSFSVAFYMFTGFSFIPVAAAQMSNPEKVIPKALVTVMSTVTILYCLVQAIVIGILGTAIVKYDIPIAQALDTSLGHWAYILIIVGMIVSIFGVAFSFSFNTPILVASLANEHNLLPKVLGKKNKHNAPYMAIIVTSLISIILTRFSYIFLVGCIVLSSFIQYVPSILAVIKFKHNKQFPNHGFKLKGGYVIPIIALIISMYLLTSFSLKVFLVILTVFVVGNIVYFTSVKKKDTPQLVKDTTGQK